MTKKEPIVNCKQLNKNSAPSTFKFFFKIIKKMKM